VNKISNEEVLAKVEEDRQIMKTIQHRQHHWIGHILKHESTAGYYRRTNKGRPARGRRRLQMLHMLVKDGYVAMKEKLKTGGDGVK